MVCINACRAGTQTPTPLTTINPPQGGMIVYGLVDGANTQAAAMARLLRNIHNNCGERPQVGRVFRFRGTNSDAVFFTVTNHPQGNKQVAGMVIAAATGSNRVEAALLSDDASRFGKSVNPMLQQLFSSWHPAGAAPDSPSAAGAHSTTASGGSAAKLTTVTASDNSATLDIPDGWTLDPRSAGGAMVATGPNGEQVAFNMSKSAIDPTNPQQIQFLRYTPHGQPPGVVVYPFRGDLVKEFPNLFQAWRRSNGMPPARLEVDHIEPLPTWQGNHCIQMKGHLDSDGKGMKTLNDMMCAMDPLNFGGYSVTLSHMLIPNELFDKEEPTLHAMINSLRLNQEVINQQLQAAARQKQQNDQALMQSAQQAVDRIHAIGAQATARMNATQAANDAQHAGYWAQQDSNARNSQGFSNYMLDQTVVQNNYMNSSGDVGHATVWNSTADALVKANPDRYQYVDTANYWKGVDY